MVNYIFAGLLTTTRPEVQKCDSLAMTNWGEWNCIGSKYLGGLGGADCWRHHP